MGREYAYHDSRWGRNRSIRAKALEEFRRAWASWCIQLRNTSNMLCNDELEHYRTVRFNQDYSPTSFLVHDKEDTKISLENRIHQLS